MQKDDADARMGAPTLRSIFGKARDEFVPNCNQELGRKILFSGELELAGLIIKLICLGHNFKRRLTKPAITIMSGNERYFGPMSMHSGSFGRANKSGGTSQRRRLAYRQRG
jgi:hypothetical protein